MKKMLIVFVLLMAGCSSIDWDEIEAQEKKSYQDQQIDNAIDDALKDFDPASVEGLQ